MTTPLNFAPYSEPPPSPPRTSSRWQPPIASTSSSYQSGASPAALSSAQGTSYSSSGGGGGGEVGVGTTYWNGAGSTGREVRWRTDVEAGGAYALGLFSAVLLLMWETESDYVRFHAYQSALLSVALIALHVVFLILPSVMEGLLFGVDIIVLGFLAVRAYKDEVDLLRYQLPYIGVLAERWVEEE